MGKEGGRRGKGGEGEKERGREEDARGIITTIRRNTYHTEGKEARRTIGVSR